LCAGAPEAAPSSPDVSRSPLPSRPCAPAPSTCSGEPSLLPLRLTGRGGRRPGGTTASSALRKGRCSAHQLAGCGKRGQRRVRGGDGGLRRGSVLRATRWQLPKSPTCTHLEHCGQPDPQPDAAGPDVARLELATGRVREEDPTTTTAGCGGRARRKRHQRGCCGSGRGVPHRRWPWRRQCDRHFCRHSHHRPRRGVDTSGRTRGGATKRLQRMAVRRLRGRQHAREPPRPDRKAARY
jgi:hypothetical protein